MGRTDNYGASSEISFRAWRTWARDRVVGTRDITQLALLGTSTLDQLGEILPVAGERVGIDLVVTVAGIGRYESEFLDLDSRTLSSDPDVIVLAPDSRSIALSAVTSHAEKTIASELARWSAPWPTIRQHTSAPILQLNFAPPVDRPLGGLESQTAGSRRRVISELNRQLAEAASASGVHIVDVCGVAVEYGLSRFVDDRYWFHSKQAFALSALPYIALEIAAVLSAALGKTRKCLVIDLDNTVWGGIVGDDGPERLRLSGDSEGEAFIALQEYIVDLADRGVVIAVCSKNDDSAARAPFMQRNDMRLTLDHISAFVANWDPKPDNLRRIASQLDLALDSFAFLDDNPAEREFIRRELPEVDVIELPEDPSGFRRALSQYRGFEPVRLTDEDLARTGQYRARAAAHDLEAQASSLEEYLESLQMTATVERVSPITGQRVVQLINKTNQWNLTTRRRSSDALEEFVAEPTNIALAASLRDRFADHGLVGVLLATQDEDVLEIDTFLMSCRVIGRTLERTLIAALIDHATASGVRTIRGIYAPTPKNTSVADLYGRLGFRRVGESGESSSWELDVETADLRPTAIITIEEQHET